MIGLLIGTTVLGLGGALLIVIGVRASAQQAGFNQRAVQTTGQVAGWKTERIRIGSNTYKTVHFPDVEYRTADGAVLRHSGLGASERTPLGTPVTLLYDPAHPERVSFTGKRGQLGLAKVLVAGGVMLILGAFAMLALRLTLG